MSAFICSDLHINSLVRWASLQRVSFFHDGLRHPVNGQEQEAAELLRAENTLSVNARYDLADVPLAIIYSANAKKLGPVEVLKAADCLDYQSCEHPEWAASKAYAACQAIKESAIRILPGYDAADWEIRA